MSDNDSRGKSISGNISEGGKMEEKHSGLFQAPSISDFLILKPISRGAFGKVFLGQKKGKADPLYAIKVMKKADMVNKNMVNQVITERDALAVSKSPSIVRLFYSLQSKENIYLVMEYMIGGDVKSLLGMYGYFDEDMAVRYIAEVVHALGYLHSHSIIHRDLKPDNMLISDKGHIKLTDFGLSKINLNRQIGICDIVNTPCARKEDRTVNNYFRTPGQVLSLTSSLAFSAQGKRRQQLISESGYRGSWGSATPCTPLGSNCVRASTPHYTEYKTPPPIKALTPTLQESVHWKSTASEHSLSAIDRGISTVSEITEDEVFTPGNNNSQPSMLNPRESLSIHNLALRDISNTIDSHNGCMQQQRGRNGDSTSSNDDDTPHLYRSKETLQESYAAKHLRSMREGSSEPESKPCVNFEKDFLQDVSVSSIETQRHRDLSQADSPRYPSISLSIDESPPNTSCSSLKKRPFSSVERSPLHARTSHTNLTMEFDGFAIGDEHRRKRIIRNIETRVKQKSHHKIQRLRSFSSRLSKSKSRLSRKSDKSFSIGSSLSSPVDSNVTVDSLMYLGSVSSIGSYADSSPFPLISKSKEECGPAVVASSLPEICPQFSSPMIVSSDVKGHSPMQPGCSDFDSKQAFTLNQQTTFDFNLMNENSDNENKETFQSMRLMSSPCSFLGNRDVSMELSPCSEITRKSSLDPADAKLVMSSSSPDSDPIAEPLPKTPDSGLNQDVNILNNPFKTPSPASQKSSLTSPTEMTNSSRDTGYDLESSLSMGEDLGLQRLFVNTTDMSSDTSENDLDSSFHELSIGGSNVLRRASLSRQGSEDLESTKIVSPCSVSSTPTTATITPNTSVSYRLDKQNAEKVESGRVKNKLLKKVTTFMSLPASSGASEGDDSDGVSTPAMRGPLKKRNFMTPGITRYGRTPMRTPKTIHRRPAVENDENGRILGTPDYLAPELLLQREHSYGVDMWALGVCLYEFLTGIPPFNDVSPELVFQHILNRDLEWPEGEEALSANAQAAIESLLNPDPHTRPKASDVQSLELFSDIDWEHLQDAEMPFVPDPDDATDTCYFEARNNLQHLEISAVDINL